uniref:BRO1 domain-containing protein n=1 Tax=Oryza punctata TaxID=4537 RepID=A0A0E0MIJ7_ORYPU
MAFTVARLVETFIGLACIVVADLVFQPAARPSTKATAQLERCLAALTGCFNDYRRGRETKVQEQVALLERCVAEAAGEPHFPWSPPFPASSYHKVAGSLGRMAHLLYLYTQALAVIHPNPMPAADEHATQRFHCLVSASLERSAALLLRLSISSRNEEDLEAGIRVSSNSSDTCCCDDDEAPEMLVRSFLSQQQQQDQGAALASIGFCMGEMAKEALQLEAYMLDLTLLSH